MPRKPENDIFQLISLMSSEEKRFFKRFVRKRSSGNHSNAERLFDAIAALDTYDEEALKESLDGSLAGNLGYEKHRLLDLIPLSLQREYENQRVELVARNLVIEATLLQERGLYERSRKKLEKAKAIAAKYEFCHLLLEIIELQRFAAKRILDKDVDQQIAALIAETDRQMELLRQQIAYREIADRIFVAVRQEFRLRGSDAKDELDFDARHPMIAQFPADGTFESKKLYHFINAQFCQLSNDTQQLSHHYTELVRLWDKYPQMKEVRRIDYKISLANYLQTCHQNSNYEPFPETLRKIREMPPLSEDERVEDFQNITFLKFLWAINTLQIGKADALIPEIDAGIGRYREKMERARLIVFRYNVSVYLFIRGNHSEALRWLRPILDIRRSRHRKDIRHFARVFEIVLHFEMGNDDILEYFFRSAYRVLRRRHRLYPFEKAVLNTLKKLATASENQQNSIFRKLQQALNGMAKNGTTGFQEIQIWVESRVRNEPMLDVLREIVQPD